MGFSVVDNAHLDASRRFSSTFGLECDAPHQVHGRLSRHRSYFDYFYEHCERSVSLVCSNVFLPWLLLLFWWLYKFETFVIKEKSCIIFFSDITRRLSDVWSSLLSTKTVVIIAMATNSRRCIISVVLHICLQAYIFFSLSLSACACCVYCRVTSCYDNH